MPKWLQIRITKPSKMLQNYNKFSSYNFAAAKLLHFYAINVFAMPKCMLYELLYRKIKSNYWFKIKMRKVFEY